MPYIQVPLTDEEDSIIAELAKKQRRSKGQQLAYCAIVHAKELIDAHATIDAEIEKMKEKEASA